MNSKFFVIWGMHRSGTSLLASAMRVFGAEFSGGATLADEHNPVGYYEDPGLIRLNERMFAELGLKWHSLGAIAEEQADLLEKAGYLGEAAQYLEKSARNAPLSMLKDPRMTRLGALWRRAFRKIGEKPYSVIVWRNPAAVAASLRQRALKWKTPAPEEDMRHGFLLWLIHTQTALACTCGYPRVLVNYDQFLANPDAELRRISAALSFPLSENVLKTFCAKSVDCGLNHHGEPSRENLPQAVRALEEKLQNADQCPDPEPVWPATDEDRLLCGLLDDANRSIRESAAKMASIHSEICILTAQIKRMAFAQTQKEQ